MPSSDDVNNLVLMTSTIHVFSCYEFVGYTFANYWINWQINKQIKVYKHTPEEFGKNLSMVIDVIISWEKFAGFNSFSVTVRKFLSGLFFRNKTFSKQLFLIFITH